MFRDSRKECLETVSIAFRQTNDSRCYFLEKKPFAQTYFKERKFRSFVVFCQFAKVYSREIRNFRGWADPRNFLHVKISSFKVLTIFGIYPQNTA